MPRCRRSRRMWLSGRTAGDYHGAGARMPAIVSVSDANHFLPGGASDPVERVLGVRTLASVRLVGGDEAVVQRVETAAGTFVLHQSPPWRTRAELEWTHAVAAHAAQRIPAVVAPIVAHGQTVFEHGGRLLAFFPFVE